MKKISHMKRSFRSKSDNNIDPNQIQLSGSSDNNDNLVTSKGLLRPSRFSSQGSGNNPLSSRSGSSERPVSILGNSPISPSTAKEDAGSLFKPKGLTKLFHGGTLTRNKKNSDPTGCRNGSSSGSGANTHTILAPPMPPIAPAARLRRANSSTLSLTKNKRKMLTLDDLYVEILYTILHMIGCEVKQDEQVELILHLKDAFHMEEDRHRQLLETATMREEPYLKANLEIFEARGLIGKDISGNSDPFCTFYLTTNPLARYNTSYKARTLNPVWNEDFVLDVNSVENDGVRIDIWDFNPEENVSEKLSKVNQIKDSRGLRKFIKETLNASTGKISHDLLGSVEIPLKDVPSSGIQQWYPLQKPDGKSKRFRGEVRTGLTLSTEKDQNLTAQEHRHLLKILFSYELQHSQAEPFSWNGIFNKNSVTILAQHAVQGKLEGKDTALARWLVYAHTHCDLPLDYRVFVPILDQLKYAMNCNLFIQDDESRFIEVATVFINHCIEFIKKHRHFIGQDEKYFIQLQSIVSCLKVLHECLDDENKELLKVEPKPMIGYRNRRRSGDSVNSINSKRMSNLSDADKVNRSIIEQVEEAVIESITDTYQFTLEKMPPLKDTTNVSLKLKNLTTLVRLLLSDLKEGCAKSDILFRQELNVNYIQKAYEIYEDKLTTLIRSVVENASAGLKQVIFLEETGADNETDLIKESLTTGTNLFELYLALQSFSAYGQQIFNSERSTEMYNNHLWFNKAVTRWLDVALYKAMQRILKAVSLDNLQPMDELVKHSSSAVDLRTVLIQIKTFWKELNWPDVEGSYALISKILDDICKTTIFYADQMCKRVVAAQGNTVSLKNISLGLGLGNSINDGEYVRGRRRGTFSDKFIVTPEICLAINDIDYVLQFIDPFVKELGMEDTLARLQALDGDQVAAACRTTLTILVQNAMENVENKIFEVLDIIAEKMAPVIQRFLVEGSSRFSYSGNCTENLVNYLDKNLLVLKEKLNGTNFERILTVIWESSAQSLNDTIHLSIERRKPPQYFTSLLDTLDVLINFFYDDKPPQDETLLKMKSLLQLYASDSTELISRYLWERHREQMSIKQGDYQLGSITIRCQLLREHLRIEILNARHLKPPDPLSVRIGDQSRMLAKRNSRMNSSANLSRSSRNLQWVKSKFKSLRSNLHEASVHFHTTTNAGQSDPYVSIRMVPAIRFHDCPKQKTRTQRRTLFPLFDETFDFVIRHEPHRLHDSYVLMTVKDNSFIGGGIFLGEALLKLEDIPLSQIDQNLSELPQMQLPLTKPSCQDSDIMLALDSRAFDRLAKDFLQKEKRKL